MLKSVSRQIKSSTPPLISSTIVTGNGSPVTDHAASHKVIEKHRIGHHQPTIVSCTGSVLMQFGGGWGCPWVQLYDDENGIEKHRIGHHQSTIVSCTGPVLMQFGGGGGRGVHG